MPVLHTKPAPRGVGRGGGGSDLASRGTAPPATSSHTSTAMGSIGEAETGSIRPQVWDAVVWDTSPQTRVGDTGPGPTIDHGPPTDNSTVNSTVNSQSTHSQLDSQLTVNSTVNSTVNGAAKSWIYITIL